MDDSEAGRYWEQNAHAWTVLAREGCDVYRDLVNTPGFFELLPPVAGLRGLDVGCGEGHNTRLLAKRGSRMCAIDVAPTFARYAHEAERQNSMGIRYAVASGQQLPFQDAAFDFATAFMSLMDMPEPDLVLREVRRILAPGGFFQFSITHPCFDPPYRKKVKDRNGKETAIEVGRYFEEGPGPIQEWLFSGAHGNLRRGLRPFRTPKFHRTLSGWLNSIVSTGFQIERVAEPRADRETAARFPSVADTRIVAYFLHIRCRKPK
jgi:SAM-dependent methyltransferase